MPRNGLTSGWLLRPARPDGAPAGENEPTPDQRLPPRETRTKLSRTAARTPAPNWKC